MTQSDSDPAREALARFRAHASLRDTFDDEAEDTGVHVHLPPAQAPEGAGMSKLKAALIALGTGLGTGIVMALLQHFGAK